VVLDVLIFDLCFLFSPSIIECTDLIDISEFLSNVSKRCPAIRLAVRRTHSVIGRIILLIISIMIINIINIVGVPCGTRCVNM